MDIKKEFRETIWPAFIGIMGIIIIIGVGFLVLTEQSSIFKECEKQNYTGLIQTFNKVVYNCTEIKNINTSLT